MGRYFNLKMAGEFVVFSLQHCEQMILDLSCSRAHRSAIQNPDDSMKCILCVFTKFHRINHHPFGQVNMNSSGSSPRTFNRVHRWEIVTAPMEAVPSLPTVIYDDGLPENTLTQQAVMTQMGLLCDIGPVIRRQCLTGRCLNCFLQSFPSCFQACPGTS